MDVEVPYSQGGIDDFTAVLKALVHDPIFLALVGCALIAWLLVSGPTLNKPQH